MSIEAKLQEIKSGILKKIEEADNVNVINDIKVSVLGKKGELTQVLKSMKDLPPEERPVVGQMVNSVRAALEEKIAEKTKQISKLMLAEKMKRETIDVTLPGVRKMTGHRHPNQIALQDLERVFIGMGYDVVEGAEIEYDRYNFELLNIPANHPAKDEQDTFYITNDILLRTQTSSVQARIMEKGQLPIKVISPGRVFRSDEVDATHSPSFHQVEGLVVDKGITMADLKKLGKEGAILLDVRSPQEYKEGHLNGAISLPEYEIRENVEKILKNKKEVIIVYCSSGSRSKKAQKELIEMGYETVYNLPNALENYVNHF